MSKIKIMTDSASDIPPETARKAGLELIPIPITVDGVGYLEGVDFTSEEFYNILLNCKELPTTSQINAVTYCEKYHEAYAQGFDTIILISLNSLASQTYQSAVAAKELLFANVPKAREKLTIHIVDSKSFSVTYGYPALEAAKMAREGRSAEMILAYLDDWFSRLEVYFTAFSFEFIKRSGRVGVCTAMVGEALGIRPVVSIIDGKFEICDKARGNSAVMKKMALLARNRRIESSPYLMLSGTQPGAAEDMAGLMRHCTGLECSGSYKVGSAVAINSGPKMLGICFLGEKRSRS